MVAPTPYVPPPHPTPHLAFSPAFPSRVGRHYKRSTNKQAARSTAGIGPRFLIAAHPATRPTFTLTSTLDGKAGWGNNPTRVKA